MPHLWEMTRDDFPTYESFAPKRRHPVKPPMNHSEAELHRFALQYRLTEKEPPLVKRTPTGTWAISEKPWSLAAPINDRYHYEYGLYQLREFPLARLTPSETWKRPVHIIEKYARWHEEGSPLPPIFVIERETDFKVVNGHHRLDAAFLLHLPTIQAWVSPAVRHRRVWRDGLSTTSLYALTYGQVIRNALKLSFNVPQHVIDNLPIKKEAA